MDVTLEGTGLNFIRQKQTSLRSEVLHNLTNYLELNLGANNVDHVHSLEHQEI